LLLVVEDALDNVRVDARSPVRDNDALVIDRNLDPRFEARVLGVVERVVGQFLDDDLQPPRRADAGTALKPLRVANSAKRLVE
jgi:hypothetical protein